MAPATATAPQDAKSDLLYEQIVDRIVALIDGGTLRVGQRVPSVRKLSRQMGVSISTVLQAYRLLERRGRIEARPQSGYYVRAALAPTPVTRDLERPPRSATRVTIADPIGRMLAASTDAAYVHLGGAIPSDAMSIGCDARSWNAPG